MSIEHTHTTQRTGGETLGKEPAWNQKRALRPGSSGSFDVALLADCPTFMVGVTGWAG